MPGDNSKNQNILHFPIYQPIHTHTYMYIFYELKISIFLFEKFEFLNYMSQQGLSGQIYTQLLLFFISISQTHPHTHTHTHPPTHTHTHTHTHQLFAASCGQFDKLRKKEAFLDQFKKQPMFSDDLSELDDSRRVVQEVIDEYRASTEPDYITRGTSIGLVRLSL